MCTQKVYHSLICTHHDDPICISECTYHLTWLYLLNRPIDGSEGPLVHPESLQMLNLKRLCENEKFFRYVEKLGLCGRCRQEEEDIERKNKEAERIHEEDEIRAEVAEALRRGAERRKRKMCDDAERRKREEEKEKERTQGEFKLRQAEQHMKLQRQLEEELQEVGWELGWALDGVRDEKMWAAMELGLRGIKERKGEARPEEEEKMDGDKWSRWENRQLDGSRDGDVDKGKGKQKERAGEWSTSVILADRKGEEEGR